MTGIPNDKDHAINVVAAALREAYIVLADIEQGHKRGIGSAKTSIGWAMAQVDRGAFGVKPRRWAQDFRADCPCADPLGGPPCTSTAPCSYAADMDKERWKEGLMRADAVALDEKEPK